MNLLTTRTLTCAALVCALGWASAARAQRGDLDSLLAAIDPFDVTSLAIPGETTVELRNERLANSELDEYGPTFYGESIVFASARKPPEFLRVLVDEDHDQNFTSLFRAPIDERTRELVGVATFGGRLNHVFHDATPTFSVTGDTVYLTRSHSRGRRRLEGADGYMYLSIFAAHKKGDNWSQPEPLAFCTRDSDEMHPALSPDGRRMYFTSDRAGGFGQTDIYVVERDTAGRWGAPVNLGPQVNRPDREGFPSVTAAGTVYFSSDVPGGLGGFDIYRAEPNGRGGYALPQNLGDPYNSEADDTGYITPDGGATGYFASARPGGLGGDDLYGFTATTGEPTAPSGTLVAHLAGYPDSTVEGVAVTLFPTGDPVVPPPPGIEAGSVRVVTEESGQVAVELSRGLEYDFDANLLGYAPATGSLVFDRETLTAYVALEPRDLAADTARRALAVSEERLRPGLVVELANIFFDFDRVEIRGDAHDDLDSLAALMLRFPSLEIELLAHTDQQGPTSYNRGLSARRAASAEAYLTERGVPAERLTGLGLGESQPRIDCGNGRRCGSTEHQLNRRVEFRVTRFEPPAGTEIEVRGAVSEVPAGAKPAPVGATAAGIADVEPTDAELVGGDPTPRAQLPPARVLPARPLAAVRSLTPRRLPRLAIVEFGAPVDVIEASNQ